MVLNPLYNPIGFGTADFVELGAAAALVSLAAWSARVEAAARALAGHRVWSLLLLAALPVALRLALLPSHPVPFPDVYDEFGHLLVADTLRHWRLANPPHPFHRFFETFFVLQEPSYGSIYPLGQGIALAFGRALFGVPWAGVLCSTAALCALVYWMLRAWASPLWALIGGLLAVVEFGPLSQWMNDYWGGALAAVAGCLVFGSLPRGNVVLLGLGLGMHWLTRPFETIFLLPAVALWRPKRAWVALLVMAPAFGLTLLHDRAMTGNWLTLPYRLSQQQYGVPAALTFQENPKPRRELTPQQESGYKMQAVMHGPDRDSVGAYLRRFVYRVGFYSFFLLPPLWIAAPAFLWRAREKRLAWVLGVIALFMLGENFYPYFQPHYAAVLTPLFLLVSVLGLQTIARWSPLTALFLLVLCGVHFVYWYGVRLQDDASAAGPQRRIAVARQLAALPGRQLVFVRYWPNHIFQEEWVYNEADIDGARVVWARDLGPEENEKLREYYPDRTAWLLQPDDRPPSLSAYQVEPPREPAKAIEPAEAHPAEPGKPKPKPLQPTLRFEDVK